MAGRLSGKVAVVTGGASGVGRAAAMAAAREGARVVVADYDEEATRGAAGGISEVGGEAVAVKADVSKEAEVEAVVREAVERFGRLDVLFNNAAVALVGRDNRVTEVEEEVWDYVLAVNLKGVYLGCKHAIPAMIEGGGGAVVNNASIAALVAEPDLDAYTAAKGGVLALTRSVAANYAGEGVRCNAICPGLVRTPMASGIAGDVLERFERETLLPVGEPEDVAHLVIYLASDESRYVTGSTYVIDGGYTAR